MNSRWPIRNLGEYTKQASLRNRSLQTITVYSVTNSQGFTRSEDYFSKEIFSKDLSNYKIVKKNEFAYNPSRINVGSIACLTESDEALISPLYIVFSINLQNLHPGYLLRFLKSNNGIVQIKNNTQGSVRDSLKYDGLANIQIPLPPLPEQIAIANILSQAEALIAKRKESLSLLDAYLKSTFLEMFGDPVRNGKGWEVKRLEEVSKLARGRFSPRPRNDPKYFNGKYPFIQTGDISQSNHRLNLYTQTINELGISVSKQFLTGDIVIAIVGATIGATAILEIDAYATDSIIGIKADHKNIGNIFLEFSLRFWREPLLKNAPEAARPNINLEILNNLGIILPPLKLQNQFSAIVEKVEALKEKYQKGLGELENLYGSLSQRAFRGDLGVGGDSED